MSGADLIDCETLETPRTDRDEGDLDESDEVALGPLEDGVQPPIATDPGQGPLNDPPNTLRDEGSAVPAGAGFDGDAERLAGLGQPLAPIAEITQGCPLEAAVGKLTQHRDNAPAVMPVCWRDVDRQRETILVHGEMDLDAFDFLAAIEAAAKATRGRMT